MFDSWYVTRDSDRCHIFIYPAELTGIRKYKGCCFYMPTHDLRNNRETASQHNNNWGMLLSLKTCKKIFGCCPEEGQLLYVEKTQKGWKAEEIDLAFS